LVFLVALTLLAINPPAFAQQEPVRAVLELFTSQGCSSSPMADEVLATLAKDRSLITLSMPVDYWDYTGWKDTFGSPVFSARQRAYADGRGDRQVFTPQLVVNGLSSAIGSKRRAVAAAIDETRRRPDVMSARVKIAEAGGRISINVVSSADTQGELWLAALASSRTVAVERGENAHRKLSYVNVVRKLTRLGTIQEGVNDLTVARADVVPADADNYVVLVQRRARGKPGAILGAAVAH